MLAFNDFQEKKCGFQIIEMNSKIKITILELKNNNSHHRLHSAVIRAKVFKSRANFTFSFHSHANSLRIRCKARLINGTCSAVQVPWRSNPQNVMKWEVGEGNFASMPKKKRLTVN